MPELPEVETIVRTLKPQIGGKTIQSARALLPRAVQFGAERLELLAGARVLDLCRRAKLLIISLAQDETRKHALPQTAENEPELPDCLRQSDLLLVFHLKMTGRFFVHPKGTAPLPHTRIVFDLGDSGLLFFDDMRTFGYCRVMTAGELPGWPFWAALGPEPLEMEARELAMHFARSFAGRRGSIKSALLDQGAVAGVGNIYADEALFRAGVDPNSRAGAVPQEGLLKLAQGLQAVLRKSIEECGSSIRDYRDALGNAGAFQNSFAVYGRKGEKCQVCASPLEACRLSGRGTVFCPACQKRF